MRRSTAMIAIGTAALAALVLTLGVVSAPDGLLASSHGPSGASATSRSEANDLASCVSFTDGLACRPTALVSLALATTKLFDIFALTLPETVLQPHGAPSPAARHPTLRSLR